MVLISSITYLINNYFFYQSKWAESEKLAIECFSAIELLANKIDDAELQKNTICQLVSLYEATLTIEKMDNADNTLWRYNNNYSYHDESRKKHITEYDVICKANQGKIKIFYSKAITPNLFKSLGRAWSGSLLDYLKSPEIYSKYKLIRRSTPLWWYSGISFIIVFIGLTLHTRLILSREKKITELEKQKTELERQIRNYNQKIQKKEDELKRANTDIEEYIKYGENRDGEAREKQQEIKRLKEEIFSLEKQRDTAENAKKELLCNAQLSTNEIKHIYEILCEYIYKPKSISSPSISSHHGSDELNKVICSLPKDFRHCFEQIQSTANPHNETGKIRIQECGIGSKSTTEGLALKGEVEIHLKKSLCAFKMIYSCKKKNFVKPVGFLLTMLLKMQDKDYKSYDVTV